MPDQAPNSGGHRHRETAAEADAHRCSEHRRATRAGAGEPQQDAVEVPYRQDGAIDSSGSGTCWSASWRLGTGLRLAIPDDTAHE